MPDNGLGASPCPDSSRVARPAFMDLPDKTRRVGPPPCRWEHIAVDYESCTRPSVIGRYGGPLLCAYHAVKVAEFIDYTSRDAAHKAAEKAAQHKVNMMKREIERLHARLMVTAPEPKPSRPKRDPDQAGTIYFLRSGAYFKIGWTSNLEQRMKGYAPDTQLLAAHPGTRRQELALHKRFAHLLGRGREWFVFSPEIEDHIDSVIAEHGRPPVVDFVAKKANRYRGRQKQYVGGPNRGPMLPRS